MKAKQRKILNRSYYSVICLFLNNYKLVKKDKNSKFILLKPENKNLLLKIEKYKKLKRQLKKNKKINLDIEEMKIDRQKLLRIIIELIKFNS